MLSTIIATLLFSLAIVSPCHNPEAETHSILSLQTYVLFMSVQDELIEFEPVLDTSSVDYAEIGGVFGEYGSIYADLSEIADEVFEDMKSPVAQGIVQVQFALLNGQVSTLSQTYATKFFTAPTKNTLHQFLTEFNALVQKALDSSYDKLSGAADRADFIASEKVFLRKVQEHAATEFKEMKDEDSGDFEEQASMYAHAMIHNHCVKALAEPRGK